MDQPTEEERLNFVKSYGVEPVEVNTDFTFKDAAKTVAEFTPIIGDAMAAKEIYDELQKEDPDYRFVAILGGAALVGAVPGIGDVAAKGIRKAANMIKRIEVDPDALGMMGGNIRIKPKTAANQPNIISFTEKRKEIIKAKELQDTYDALNADVKEIAKRKQKLVKEAEKAGIFGEYEVGATVQGRNKKGPLPFKIEGHSLDEVKLDSPSFKRLQDRVDGDLTIIEKDGKYYIPKLITSDGKGGIGSSYLDLVKLNNYPIMGKLGVVRAAIKEESGRGLVRDVDDLVDTWAKGNISNKELRDSAKELGVEINTKRITKNRDSSDIEITMPDGNIYTGVNTIPDEVVDPEYVKGLTKPADTDALQELGLTDEALEAWKKENYAKDKFRVERLEKLEDAAKALREGEITSGEFRELADAYMPIVPIEKMPNFPTKEEVVQALHATDKRKVTKGIVGVNKTIKDGTPISARLDIPAYNDTDTWVVSLHDGTTKNGDTVGYAQTAVLNDVNFTTNPLAASAIAAGNVKTTIARMNGSYVNADPEEVYKSAKQILEANPEDWTQVGMNPNRASYFYDKADGMPVTSADQVIQVGPLVFARNVKKTRPDDEMFEFTNKRTGVTANFSEGGMAIEEQMNMNFGDVPDNTIGIDPVSGNEIPMGSTAENVRDDIPANLSEGEIVVAADVVNFHGVKLFEDLRAEAKMGYAQMDQDGRMGGEPMDDMGMDIELSELDLEVMDDEAPVEMARGGMNVERGRGNMYSSYSAPKAKPTRDRSMSAVVSRAQANKNKPKNRFEALRERIRDIFDDDDRRVTLDKKPPKSDPIRPSIAQQINFGGDYKDKEPTKAEPKKRRSSVRGAGDVTQAYRGENEPLNVRYYDQPFYKRLMEGLGYDEGGLATDEQPHLIGGEDQFNQPFYAPDQKGGFDMENAYANYGDGTGGGPLLEMREYMNDEGHRIFITFIDGVPQMEIPAGYYPVGDDTVVASEVPPVGGSGGSDSGGSGGGGIDMPAPTPVNYKELSMEELSKMIEDQKNMKGNILAAGISVLNPIVGGAIKLAMWNETRQLKKELERRRDDIYTSEVDKRRYDQLLEIANAEEPGLMSILLGKITGNDPYAPEVRTPEQTDALYTQLDKMTKAYTPSDQEASSMTTPGVDDGIDWKAEGAKASKAAADKAFKDNPVYKQKKQDEFIQSVKDDPDSFLPPTPSRPSRNPTTNVALDNQSAADAAMGRPTSRKPSKEDQMMVQGINKGGLASKKKKKKKSK